MTPPDLQTASRTIAGRYRLISELGRGGMGIVYSARDERLGRLVAIKALNETLSSNAEARDMFLQEGRQLATFSHPNLVAIYDVTTEDGQDLLISEFVDGQNLDELLTAGPLDLPTALSIAIQMCEGIAFLHDQGVIHRDIKPANVMLKPDGSIKIIDFGLARSLDQILRKGTQMRGTPVYMAPEQLFGPSPSEATDIYQLAVTFYELLTTEFPFELNPEAAWAHLNSPVCTPLIERIADIPLHLSNTLQACIAREPSERPSLAVLLGSLADVYKTLPHTTVVPMPGGTSRLLEALRADRTPFPTNNQPAVEAAPLAPELSDLPELSESPAASKKLIVLLAAIVAAILIALVTVFVIATQPEPTPAPITVNPALAPQQDQPALEKLEPEPTAPIDLQAAQQQAGERILEGLSAAATDTIASDPADSPTPNTNTNTPDPNPIRKPVPKPAQKTGPKTDGPLTVEPSKLPAEPLPTKTDPPTPEPLRDFPTAKFIPPPIVAPVAEKKPDPEKTPEKTTEPDPKPVPKEKPTPKPKPEVPRFF